MHDWTHDIIHPSSGRTFSVSAENPTGRKGGGAQASPGDDRHTAAAARKLGRGWKARPCLREIGPGEEIVLADLDGPGRVLHMWMTVEARFLRSTALVVTLDGAPGPSVCVPIGDFFVNGIDGLARVQSIPVAVNPRGGMNAYWPMPFRERMRVAIRNDATEPIPEFFYQITGERGPLPEDVAFFHATWRRSTTAREEPEHVILDAVSGSGHYVGTALVWHQLSTGWWGEGEMKFFLDGDPPDAPSICGTGTEDYFGGAWGFAKNEPGDARPQTYTGPYLGYPQAVYEATSALGPRPPAHGLYRWHLTDPIRFESDLRVTVQALGWWPDGTFQPLADDIASTAYWYQRTPAPVTPLPAMSFRWPR